VAAAPTTPGPGAVVPWLVVGRAGGGQGWWWAGREEGFLEEYLEVMGMNLDMAEFGFCSLANLLIKFDLQC
jgi:hypothetical protein